MRATAWLGKTPSPAVRPPPRLSCFGCWVKMTLMLPCSLTWHGILQKKKRRQHANIRHFIFCFYLKIWMHPKSSVCWQTPLSNIIKCNFRCRPFTLHFYILWPPNQFLSSQSLFDLSPSTSRVFSEQTYYLLFLRSPGSSSHLFNHLALISVLVLLLLSVALCHVNCLCFFCLIFFPKHYYPARHVGGILFFRLKGEKTTFSLFF